MPATQPLHQDLDDRGMLETTLVITAGEFGRTPKLIKTNEDRVVITGPTASALQWAVEA